MKFTITPEQTAAILETLHALYISPFHSESSTPKYNAQRNLSGRTHYVEDDTLRWHKSKVLSAQDEADGLLFWIAESAALDMHNTKRGFRYVVFDVFGTCINRPGLEECTTTRAQARKKFDAVEIDVAAHYRAVFAEMAKRKADELTALQSAKV